MLEKLKIVEESQSASGVSSLLTTSPFVSSQVIGVCHSSTYKSRLQTWFPRLWCSGDWGTPFTCTLRRSKHDADISDSMNNQLFPLVEKKHGWSLSSKNNHNEPFKENQLWLMKQNRNWIEVADDGMNFVGTFPLRTNVCSEIIQITVLYVLALILYSLCVCLSCCFLGGSMALKGRGRTANVRWRVWLVSTKVVPEREGQSIENSFFFFFLNCSFSILYRTTDVFLNVYNLFKKLSGSCWQIPATERLCRSWRQTFQCGLVHIMLSRRKGKAIWHLPPVNKVLCFSCFCVRSCLLWKWQLWIPGAQEWKHWREERYWEGCGGRNADIKIQVYRIAEIKHPMSGPLCSFPLMPCTIFYLTRSIWAGKLWQYVSAGVTVAWDWIIHLVMMSGFSCGSVDSHHIPQWPFRCNCFQIDNVKVIFGSLQPMIFQYSYICPLVQTVSIVWSSAPFRVFLG